MVYVNQRVHNLMQKKKSIPNTITIYIVNSGFFPFLVPSYVRPIPFFRLSPISYRIRSIFYFSIRSTSFSDFLFLFFLLLVLFFPLFWTIRSVSCRFPYYFACHFCFPDSLMIFLINIKINNKHNIMDLWIFILP